MPTCRKYDQETRERAVRMYLDRLNEGDISKRGARVEIGELLGINEQTLRNWVRDQVGEGGTPATEESVWDIPSSLLKRMGPSSTRPDPATGSHAEITYISSLYSPPRSRVAS